VDAREKSSIMDAATVRDGRDRAIREDDGRGVIGRAMWKVLGVEVKPE
jgi:hypothetical protein